MKRTVGILALALAILVVVAAVASAAVGGIGGTKHNLSTTGTSSIRLTAGTTEICVFCHTPHGARQASEAAPLWNRLIDASGFTPYTSISLDASTAGGPTGASIACLSCHDGTIAFDALRNLPGSGGYDPLRTTAGWTFTGAAAGNLMPDGITKLGKELRDDHPISMKYADAMSPSSSIGTNDNSTGFNNPPGFPDDTKDLYFANGVKITGGYVQCTSCHDPHRSDTETFLRTSNANSALCLTCHKKDS